MLLPLLYNNELQKGKDDGENCTVLSTSITLNVKIILMVMLRTTKEYEFGKVILIYGQYFLMYVSVDTNKQGHAEIALYNNLLVFIKLTSVHGCPSDLLDGNSRNIQ